MTFQEWLPFLIPLAIVESLSVVFYGGPYKKS